MNEPFSDDLISAYLDGELSSDERARVEAEMAARPELRRLLEEMHGLSRDLQALPFSQLDAQFSDRVLDAIRDRAKGTLVFATVPAESQLQAMSRNRTQWSLTRNQWLLASAAAIFLAIVLATDWSPREEKLAAPEPGKTLQADDKDKGNNGKSTPSAMIAVDEPKKSSDKKNDVSDDATESVSPEVIVNSPKSNTPSNDPMPDKTEAIVASPPKDEPSVPTKGAPSIEVAPPAVPITIRLVMSEATWKEKPIDRLLGEQGVRLLTAAERALRAQAHIAKSGNSGEKMKSTVVDDKQPKAEGFGPGGGLRMVFGGVPTDDKPEVVEIEATEATIQRLLAAVRERKEKLRFVDEAAAEKHIKSVVEDTPSEDKDRPTATAWRVPPGEEFKEPAATNADPRLRRLRLLLTVERDPPSDAKSP